MYSMESAYHTMHHALRWTNLYNENTHYEKGVGDLPISVHRAGPIWTPSRGEHWVGRCLLRCSGTYMKPQPTLLSRYISPYFVSEEQTSEGNLSQHSETKFLVNNWYP